MIRKIEDFLNEWQMEKESTEKVLKAITPEAARTEQYPGGRTIGYIGWHIVLTLPEMAGKTGLKVEGPEEHAPEPENFEDVVKQYHISAQSVYDAVKNTWKDEDLDTEVDMYGQKWKNGQTLSALIKHEVHHRGQISALLRQTGVAVPGVYGPAREEWGAYGLPPMK
ncbi:MAG: DinB family protein [Firmicutes bacterium]|nr:DinB family protein [Bacillota bacterium]